MTAFIFSVSFKYLLLYFALGLGAGFFAGTLGVGGGIIVVPSLYWIFSFLGKDPSLALHSAVATSLGIMVITSLSASCLHISKKRVSWKPVLWTSLGSLLGAFWGPFSAGFLPVQRLKTTLAIAEILMGIFLFFKSQIYFFNQSIERKKSPSILWFIFPGLIIAYFCSLLGIGGGMFYVPLFIFLGYSIHQSVAASTLCIFPLAVIGTLFYLILGIYTQGKSLQEIINLEAFSLIAIGSLIGSLIGAGICYKIPQTFLRIVFASLLIAVGIFFFI